MFYNPSILRYNSLQKGTQITLCSKYCKCTHTCTTGHTAGNQALCDHMIIYGMPQTIEPHTDWLVFIHTPHTCTTHTCTTHTCTTHTCTTHTCTTHVHTNTHTHTQTHLHGTIPECCSCDVHSDSHQSGTQ